MNKSTIKAIEDFLIIKSDEPEIASLCFCFGFPRKELSDKASVLFKAGHCKYILVAGGLAKSPKTYDKIFKNTTEAEWHRNRLIKLGIPKERILIESKSTNSLENVVFSKKLIFIKFGSIPSKIIVIHKVFHGRRALMTLRKNLSPNTKYILQLTETPNHKIKNWWKNKKLKNHIIDEIRKIGEYTLKGDLGIE